QYVRRHKHRIGKQPRVDVVAVSGGFFLELSHARKLAEHRVAVEHPRQLGVSGHMALDKKYIVRVVYPAGEIHREQLTRAAAKLSRVLTDGYGVKIDDAEYAVVFLLKPDPVFERAEIIAYRDLTGRLNARKDPFFRCCVGIHRYLL